MHLSGLLTLIRGTTDYRRLLAEAKSSKTGAEPQAIVLPEAARPVVLACLYQDLGCSLLVVTASAERARQLMDELPSWLEEGTEVLPFPEPDALPYEPLPSDPYTIQQRLRVLSALALDRSATLSSKGAVLVVASARALASKTFARRDFTAASHQVRQGMSVRREDILRRWMDLGYELETGVEVPGTISYRGDILDIYSPLHEYPTRIELLGDQVDSIRLFDPATQRSLTEVAEVTVVPACEPAPLADGATPPEHQAPNTSALRQAQDGALLDYLPAESLIVLEGPDSIADEIKQLHAEATEMRRHAEQSGEVTPTTPRPYLLWAEIEERLKSRVLYFQEWENEETHHALSFGPPPAYGGRLPELLEKAKAVTRRGQRLVLVSQQAPRLAELLEEKDVLAFPVSEVRELPPVGSVTLVQGSLGAGWTLGPGGRTALLTDTEVFGFQKRRRAAPRRPFRRQAFLSQLSPGDYVVHVDHGIARFAGTRTMSRNGGEHEYLMLEYADSDRLYVPSEQVDRVTRYVGPGGYAPALSRLGTQEWNRTKQRVREAAAKLAGELLSLYSSRQVLPGLAFSPDTPWQREIEASFPYVETPDQLEAVGAIKQDMESLRPMDRLVCGDVGYGKTEVALRAAFKAVMEGMQVAVLVPTTVLAQQHFSTFRERMAPFPVKIELLSRFRSPREQQEVVERLVQGTVDICIGTHRLLQKDVSFKNLGLVIIDEEQRFGVAHKERLKQLRHEVDVLTLSATPIPRTLHMSLAGVRDLSTMETPPEERLPIKTFVGQRDDRIIREAILRELDRNGQVFFVHNRVQRIGRVARELAALVPEARIGVGHGQMPEEQLESVMLDFSTGKIDVLVCTTIIESGLDLPNANTIIVDDADKLGLTQLYQLRGRVGRGSTRAYGYFLYGKGKRLSETARKRLRTIFEATELGAGFQIALRDLEIRGAGNLLGPQQSGHMGAVGFDLYNRLLAEAVEEIKAQQEGRPPRAEVSGPTLDLPLAAHIPKSYVPDLAARLALYQRLAGASSPEQVRELEGEMEDRFGGVPEVVGNLLYAVRVKILGSRAGLQSISTEEGKLVLRLRASLTLDRAALQQRLGLGVQVGSTQLRLDLGRLGRRWRETLQQVLEALAAPVAAKL